MLKLSTQVLGDTKVNTSNRLTGLGLIPAQNVAENFASKPRDSLLLTDLLKSGRCQDTISDPREGEALEIDLSGSSHVG